MKSVLFSAVVFILVSHAAQASDCQDVRAADVPNYARAVVDAMSLKTAACRWTVNHQSTATSSADIQGEVLRVLELVDGQLTPAKGHEMSATASLNTAGKQPLLSFSTTETMDSARVNIRIQATTTSDNKSLVSLTMDREKDEMGTDPVNMGDLAHPDYQDRPALKKTGFDSSVCYFN